MRNHLLDNAKAAFVVMVVLGHLIEPIRTLSATNQALYLYLYAVHIPGLVLLSGAVSHQELTLAAIGKSARIIFIPFFAFELLYEALYALTHDHVSPYAEGFQPYWLLWYLPSLFLWRVMLPLVYRVRAPLLVSIFIGLGASCIDGLRGFFFDASRTLVWFPFFVAGYQWRSLLTAEAPSTLMRAVACGVLVGGVAVAFEFRGEYPHWLYGSETFTALGVTTVVGLSIRLGLYILSAALVWAVISLLPRSETPLGQRSKNILYVYLWHGIFIRLADDSGFFGVIGTFPPALTYALFCVVALLAFFLLSSSIATRLTDRVLFLRR
jgi:fucose 4-O-acetylase-like acetyltransferase